MEKEYVVGLLKELFSSDISEERENDILFELKGVVPDPDFLGYVFHSDEFYDSEGNLDYERVVEKGLAYKPNTIAL